jgi:NIPSNAP protein
MNRRTLLQSLPAAALLPSAAWPMSKHEPSPNEENAMPSSSPVYELRIYHVNEGKLDDLLRRFRDHTIALFNKHNMKSLAYWTPTDDPLKGKTLVYILEHPSREAATSNWQAFRDDPEWQSVRDKSETNGKLADHIDSTFLALTDFSPHLR